MGTEGPAYGEATGAWGIGRFSTLASASSRVSLLSAFRVVRGAELWRGTKRTFWELDEILVLLLKLQIFLQRPLAHCENRRVCGGVAGKLSHRCRPWSQTIFRPFSAGRCMLIKHNL